MTRTENISTGTGGSGREISISIIDKSMPVILKGVDAWGGCPTECIQLINASPAFQPQIFLFVDNVLTKTWNPTSEGGSKSRLEIEVDISDLIQSGLILKVNHTRNSCIFGGRTCRPSFTGSLTFEENPILTKTRLQGEFARLITKDNDGTVFETKGQLTLINETETDVFVRGAFGVNQIIPKMSMQTLEINSFVNEPAHFELSLIGDPNPYKTIDFPIAKRIVDLLPTARILDVSSYIVTTGDFASFVTQMLFEIDNTKSEKIATVDAMIDYFGITKIGFQVPGKSKLLDGIERQILQKVSDLIQSTGSASILNRNSDFTGSLNVQVGLPPILSPPEIIGPDQPGEPEPKEGLSTGTKIAVVVGTAAAFATFLFLGFRQKNV